MFPPRWGGGEGPTRGWVLKALEAATAVEGFIHHNTTVREHNNLIESQGLYKMMFGEEVSRALDFNRGCLAPISIQTIRYQTINFD